jgi:hypothetical protein
MLIVRQSSPSLLSWITPTQRAFVAGLFIGACGGLWVANGHVTQEAMQHVSDQYGQTAKKLKDVQTKVVPALKAQAGCEEWRANQDQVVPDNCPHPVIPPIGIK